MRVRRSPRWSSYIPALAPLVQKTTGPVLELGIGFYSTPILHWLCYEQNRPLYSFESNFEWFKELEPFNRGHHQVRHVPAEEWESIDLSGPFSVAFVDHGVPGGQRGRDVLRLKGNAEFVVAHDCEVAEKYGYDVTEGQFTYCFRYYRASPKTAIFSDSHDPREFVTKKFLRRGIRR